MKTVAKLPGMFRFAAMGHVCNVGPQDRRIRGSLAYVRRLSRLEWRCSVPCDLESGLISPPEHVFRTKCLAHLQNQAVIISRSGRSQERFKSREMSGTTHSPSWRYAPAYGH